MRLKAVIFMMFAIFALSLTLVSAQEVTETPMPDTEQAVGTVLALEEVIAAPDNYYGTTATLQGIVETIVSPQIFVLGEDATIDNDQVLAVNNFGQDFGADLMQGQRVTVSGIVHPSADAVNNDDTLLTDFDVRTAVPQDVLDQYGDFTVFEVTSMNDVNMAGEVSEGNLESVQTSLEELTTGTQQFYGQQVAFEGVIESLANVKILVLGEGAIIDNDQVLVVNRTNEEFDLAFSEGARVFVTGIVQPSIQEQMDNAATIEETNPTTVTPVPGGDAAQTDPNAPDVPDINETPATPALTPQPDMSMEATQETQTDAVSEIFSLQSLLDETQLEQYRNFTIVELTSLEDLTLVEALGDIITTADQFYDRSLMVQGTVETLVSNNAFVLNEGGLLNTNRILVMNPDSVDVANVIEGEQIRVFGTVRPYDAPTLEQDLNVTIDQTVFADYQDYTVVLADRIVAVP